MATQTEQVDLVVKAIMQGFERMARDMRSVGDAVEDLGDDVTDSGLGFTELASKVQLAQQAFSAVSGVAQGLGESLQRGAQIDATARTFDNLSESIDTTAEVMLTRLRAASANMISDLDLMESSNRFLAMGLATSADEAAELTRIATQLGSAMGKGPTVAMEEFALMLANQSIPRLDTFGISASEVRKRMAELQEANEELTREQAFLQAVMEQSAITMEKVGDASVGTAADLARLDAISQNVKASFDVAFSEEMASNIGLIGANADAAGRGMGVLAEAAGGLTAKFIDFAFVGDQTRAFLTWLGKRTEEQTDQTEALTSAVSGNTDTARVNAAATERLTALAAHYSQEVNNLGKELNDLPEEVNPKIELEADEAISKLQMVKRLLDGLEGRQVRSRVDVEHVTTRTTVDSGARGVDKNGSANTVRQETDAGMGDAGQTTP